MLSLFYLNHKKSLYPNLQPDNQSIVFWDITFSESRSLFYNGNNEEIHFTPMQYAFMRILITSECKKVQVNDICKKLWPAKDNSKETLYTLIRRLKHVVESSSNVRIITEKGGYYSLKTGTDDYQLIVRIISAKNQPFYSCFFLPKKLLLH